MRMGVGGLLKDTDARPLPRARAAGKPDEPRRRQVAALVLAAGQSTRMAPHNKLLLADQTGKPMIARVVDNVLSSRPGRSLVVTGHRGADIRAALGGRPSPSSMPRITPPVSRPASNPASPPCRAEVAAVLVCLGDMPLVTGRILDRIIAAYDPDEGRAIVLPTAPGPRRQPGAVGPLLLLRNPVPDRRHRRARIAQRYEEQVAEIETGDDAVLRDFDTVDSLATLPARLRPADTG